MGTATFDIVKPARNRGSAAATVAGELVDSGAHTTTTSASNLTNGAAGAGSAVTGRVGDIIHITGDEAMRFNVGGVAATATVGYLIQANEVREVEINAGGTISIVDVA